MFLVVVFAEETSKGAVCLSALAVVQFLIKNNKTVSIFVSCQNILLTIFIHQNNVTAIIIYTAP